MGGDKNSDPASPSYAPSIFPTEHLQPKKPKDVESFLRAQKRHSKVKKTSANLLQPEIILRMDYGIQVDLPDVEKTNQFSFECDMISSTEKSTGVNSISVKSVKVQKVLKSVMSTQTNTEQNNDTAMVPLLQFNDRQFKSFCGVSKQFFQFLLFKTAPLLKDSPHISKETKVLLLLVKLKMNVTFTVLGSFFGISHQTASRLFYLLLEIVFKAVKDYVVWFDKATIQARMPPSFKALYPNTSVIIDASEIEVERPSTVQKRVLMYSNYTSRFTVKFLVGVAPSGEITFMSKAFGGRTTDTEITVKRGFINLIEPGDVVMADKGFPSIEADLNKAGAVSVMPPFKSGTKQFTQKQNKDGYECASVQIHVERCIGRMKIFEIMNYLPNHMLPHVDKILIVISFICNCFPDLIQT